MNVYTTAGDREKGACPVGQMLSEDAQHTDNMHMCLCRPLGMGEKEAAILGWSSVWIVSVFQLLTGRQRKLNFKSCLMREW